eukprot:3100133-Pyramimonas_sp.AAC.1
MQPSPVVSSRLAAQPVHVTSLSVQKLTLPSVALTKLIRLKSSALLLVCLGPGSGPNRAPAIPSASSPSCSSTQPQPHRQHL